MKKRIYGLGSVLAIASVIPFAVACSTAENKTQANKKIADEKKIAILEHGINHLNNTNKNLNTLLERMLVVSRESQKSSLENLINFKTSFLNLVQEYKKLLQNPITIEYEDLEKDSEFKLKSKIIKIDVVKDLHFDPKTAPMVINGMIVALKKFNEAITSELTALLRAAKAIFNDNKTLKRDIREFLQGIDSLLKDIEKWEKSKDAIFGKGDLNLEQLKKMVELTWKAVRTKFKANPNLVIINALNAIISHDPGVFEKSSNKSFNKNTWLEVLSSEKKLISKDENFNIQICTTIDGKATKHPYQLSFT